MSNPNKPQHLFKINPPPQTDPKAKGNPRILPSQVIPLQPHHQSHQHPPNPSIHSEGSSQMPNFQQQQVKRETDGMPPVISTNHQNHPNVQNIQNVPMQQNSLNMQSYRSQQNSQISQNFQNGLNFQGRAKK